MPALGIQIEQAHPSRSLDPALCLRVLSHVAQRERVAISELTLVLCDHQQVRELNRTYLQHDYDTDVLAFDLRDPGSTGPETTEVPAAEGGPADEEGVAADEEGVAADEEGVAADEEGGLADEEGGLADEEGRLADEGQAAAGERRSTSNNETAFIEGEIYVDLDTAAERCEEFQASFEQEALRYAVHGLLHLIGYTDKTDAGKRRMHELENLYLGELGVRE